MTSYELLRSQLNTGLSDVTNSLFVRKCILYIIINIAKRTSETIIVCKVFKRNIFMYKMCLCYVSLCVCVYYTENYGRVMPHLGESVGYLYIGHNLSCRDG